MTGRRGTENLDGVLAQLLDRHESLARMLRGSLASLTDEEFSRPPGESAPPAGWHLWHIARWSDRFQASLADPAAPSEIWTAERLAEAYGLAPADLGVLQMGMGMEAPAAQTLPAAIGRQRFGVYQERVLDALQSAISACEPAELLAPRPSIREYAVVNGVIEYAAPAETTLLADILFYLIHTGRHYGSVEALRGL